MDEGYIAELFGLNDRVVLVTGAGSGLGEATAIGLARLGAAVAAVDLDAEGARRVAERVEAEGGKALWLQVDVARRPQVEAAVQQTLARWGALDVLVNCAGVLAGGYAAELSEEQLQKALDVNLKGTLFACQAAGRAMTERGGGSIVNFASTAALFGQPNSLAYSVSKAGVIQLTRTLAVEWGPKGVRVNCVAPGVFVTPMHVRVNERRPDFFARFLERSPLGRFGQPEEIVGTVAYLAGKGSSMVTGQLIPIDGGYTAGGYSAH
ncbi:MAG: SDR family oxidoreductase [Chloroflexi bacterium]|nr:SDR family oxidoreductase [Chloroflexota bacterium]MCL5108814.1 SDR family oxidoreductase [Chloroflexota bacterium]